MCNVECKTHNFFWEAFLWQNVAPWGAIKCLIAKWVGAYSQLVHTVCSISRQAHNIADSL